jgi:hypothetical protein
MTWILDQYNELKQQLYDYFGYKEDWVKIPIEDSRDCYWQIIGGEEHGGEVIFAPTMEQFNSDSDYFVNEIYSQRFLPKWVYRGTEYTMIIVNTYTDGNKLLQIFDNSKEVC